MESARYAAVRCDLDNGSLKVLPNRLFFSSRQIRRDMQGNNHHSLRFMQLGDKCKKIQIKTYFK